MIRIPLSLLLHFFRSYVREGGYLNFILCIIERRFSYTKQVLLQRLIFYGDNKKVIKNVLETFFIIYSQFGKKNAQIK